MCRAPSLLGKETKVHKGKEELSSVNKLTFLNCVHKVAEQKYPVSGICVHTKEKVRLLHRIRLEMICGIVSAQVRVNKSCNLLK